MTIKTKLLFSILVTVMLIAIFSVVFYQRTQRIDREIKKIEIVSKIVQVATSQRGLVLDYYRNHEERPKAQWQLLLDAQKKLMQNEVFITSGEQSCFGQSCKADELVKSIFAELVANYEKPKLNQAEITLSRKLEEVLVSQLLTKIQTSISLSYLLFSESLTNIQTAQKALIFMAGISIMVLLFFFAILFFFFNQFVARPLIKLKEIAMRIASLDFSATTTTTTSSNLNDEIGILTRAFNTMVIKLQESYTALQEKVRVRTRDLENANIATQNVLQDLQVEKAHLAEAKAKDEAMLASIGDGLVVVDLDLKVIFINRVAEAAIGWRSQEVSGKTWLEIINLTTEDGKTVPPNKGPLFLAIHEEMTTITDSSSFTSTYLYTRKDQTKFPVAITVSPIKVGGEIIGAILVFRDITHERNIDKAKTEFVLLASHQLRTPLTAISWYTEMILNGDVGKVIPAQKKYLEEIYQGDKRMIKLVNTLLDISRFELGTFKIEPKPTDIVALAEDVLNEQKLKIESGKLIVKKNFNLDIPSFSTDPRLLRMVLQNLLDNAVGYTPMKGTVRFEITSDSEKKNILITVADTGYGIPQNQQERIFGRLFRADNVRDKDTEGTGLGLYIVKSIIDQLGGKVWFKSPALNHVEGEENPGSEFYVSFPLK